jgi:hypothetical protein
VGKIIYINWHTRTFDPRLIEEEDTGQENTMPPPPQPKPAVPAKPQKEPIIISVMPEQPFPVGHRDLRPILQRDGLILMSWAIWEDWYGDETLLRRYIVTWASSQGKAHHYATKAVEEKDLTSAVPNRKGDTLYYRGAYGSRCDIHDYSDKAIADYLYLAAPFDLTVKTIPAFVRVLKTLGSTVNFDFVYRLGREREKNSKAREYLDKFPSTEIEKVNSFS